MKPGRDYIGVGVGVAIRNEKGEFLLMKRTENCRNEPGKWCFPGGGVDFGETVFDAAKREAMEEAGVDVEPTRLLKLIDHIIPEEKQHWANPIVEAIIVAGIPKIMEPHKCSEIGWFSIENLPYVTINMAEFFEDIKSGKIKL
ncbi:MAG: NUDIX domain-containing protein [Candidatus Diapherotrites archaeon]|nr:NUDIX domain-containing protein [Candidatus Diapherotrites archaeon]